MGHESSPPSPPSIRAVVRVVGAPPDALELARRLHPLGDVVSLVSGVPGPSGRHRFSFVLAGAIESSNAIVPEGATRASSPVIRTISVAREPRWHEPHAPWIGAVPRWVGLIPYESARALERRGWGRELEDRVAPHHVRPEWRRYRAALVLDHETSDVWCAGEDEPSTRELIRASMSSRLSPPSRARVVGGDEDLASHGDRIRAALDLIARGDLYQVNVARRLTLHVKGEPLDLLDRLMRKSPTSYCCYMNFSGVHVLSTTPEEFVVADPSGHVRTRPIKGTRPRGNDPAEDARLAFELDHDEKERAELAMIIDLERNDLGRVAITGSVMVDGPPRIETHRTLHHRVADITAQLRDGVSWAELVTALFPSGSVTGAPKIRAMEVIARLETHRRGLYTGAMGYVAHDGSLVLAMAIRTLTVRDEEGHYHVGGGIVADSDPAREIEETHVKSVHLIRALEDMVSEG